MQNNETGKRLIQARLDRGGQEALLAAVRGVIAEAPLYTPTMPRSGKPMSVLMTNCGPLGWMSDKQGGYRYQATHPVTGQPWPPFPPLLLQLWADLAAYPAPPEACLVNYYGPGARMGLHQDKDETDFSAPVLSVSLGDTALFRIGGTTRRAPTRALELESGDVLLLGGCDRLAYHGVDRISAGSSDLLSEGGRFNLTLRRVTQPPAP
jgi:alkylated DNA repair protein (DNA oxidative demethylase)